MQNQAPERKTVLKEKTTLSIDGYLLKDVIEDFTALLATYGDKAKISEQSYKYDEATYLALLVPELETDAEMQERIRKENHCKGLREEHERKEFERLAAKFAKE